MTTRIQLRFITPLFCKGAYDDRPEIRPPSIRGQLHWWLRALGGTATDEREIFGSIQKNFGRRGAGITTSKIVVRVGNVQADDIREFPALKHKENQGGRANFRHAFAPGSSCDLLLSERLGGIPEGRRELWMRTLETWLYLGTLGLRATRAAGSFVWRCENGEPFPHPENFDAYATKITDLVRGTKLKAALLGTVYRDAEEARRDVSDTIGGKDDRPGQMDLKKINHPLGRAFGGRKTSPLRFRIVRIGGGCRIAAVWDGRTPVTGNRDSDLAGVIQLLKERGKAIGVQLAECPF